MNKTEALKKLWRLLTALIDDKARIRRLVEQSDIIQTAQLNQDGAATEYWWQILVEAHRRHKVDKIVAKVGEEIGERKGDLEEAYRLYADAAGEVSETPAEEKAQQKESVNLYGQAMTQLSGNQIEDLVDALIHAYPSRDELTMMVRFALSRTLEAIAAGDNQRVLLFNLVTWAETNGCIYELVVGATKQNPNNPKLRDYQKRWPTSPQPTTPSRISPSASSPASIDIFLCYSHKNLSIMRTVEAALREEGISVWTDERLKAGTQNWVAAVEEAIKQAKAIIVLLSPAAKKSEWVEREVVQAQKEQKNIYPLLIDGDENNAVPFRLNTMHWVDGRKEPGKAAKEVLEQFSWLAKKEAQPEKVERQAAKKKTQQEAAARQVAEEKAQRGVMKLFLASSQESLEDLRQLSSWLKTEGHEPLPWDSPSLFLPGESTFQKLIAISEQVDAAIFIFSENDTTWYRADALSQPRDNVLVEFGIFAGALGQKKAIICTKFSTKTATDLRGITTVDMNTPRTAQYRIKSWLKSLIDQKDEDPTVAILRKELTEIKEKLEFEQEKSRQLQIILTDKNVIDFKHYNFSADAHWKLLFDYDYMRDIIDLITGEFSTPGNWYRALENYGAKTVADRINWEQSSNRSRTRMYVAKSLRIFRRYETASSYENFLRKLKQSLKDSINSVGQLRVQYLSDRGEASEKGSSDTE